MRSGSTRSFPAAVSVGVFVDHVKKADLEAETPFDPKDWPVAEPLTSESLQRAFGGGGPVRIAFYEIMLPTGGLSVFELEPDANARSLVWGDGGPLAGAGRLDDARRAELVAAIRAAPLAAFHADPKYRGWFDGHRVRLFVSAGRSACVLSSMVDDFRAAGLEPLLEHLRSLARELPRR
jgi:hypothetical protein